MLVVLVVIQVLLSLFCAGNLLKNGDFESSSFNHNWRCQQCQITQSTDSYSGKYSGLVSHRKKTGGASQTVSVTPGRRYSFKVHAKLVTSHPGYLYHNMDVKVTRTDNHGNHVNDVVSRAPYIQPGSGWHVIGGDYLVPNDTNSVKIFIDVSPEDVNYLLDSAILEEIPDLINFRSDADKRIESLRKANVSIRLDKAGVDAGQLDIQLEQTYSEFIIGCAVDSKIFLDPKNQAYRDYFYNNYEWGVPTGFQWHRAEHQEGKVNYDEVNKTVDILLAHGKKVEGHNIFWDNSLHIPSWVHNKSSTDMRAIMARRIKGLVGGFKGKVLHWDVNNENQHNDFFEQHLHDPNVTMWMFEQAHQADPETKLFLNDFGIVSKNHHNTLSYIDQAKSFMKAGVPIYGIGIESHFEQDMDITAVKYRLDQVAAVGLPIMIAALNVNQPDESKKARMYEDLYRLYFSHPAVEGITQWHFWGQNIKKPNASLTYGPNVTPNAAGKIIRQLRWEDWRTNQTFSVTRDRDLHVRAFKGDYNLRIMHHGVQLHEEQFTLTDGGVDLSVSLSGTGSQPHVDHIIIG